MLFLVKTVIHNLPDAKVKKLKRQNVILDLKTEKGICNPKGAFKTKQGINFCVISSCATKGVLSLYTIDKEHPFAEFSLYQTQNAWHIEVQNLPPSFEYTYRFETPFSKKKTLSFQTVQECFDPYGKALNTKATWGEKQNFQRTLYAPSPPFDWELIGRPMIPFEMLIIYEMHIRSFTKHASSQTQERGTFRALKEKIPYLKKLGINAIELMPIFEFDETKNLRKNPLTKKTLFNYWGYSPTSFFALMRRYGTPFDFKCLVKALHKHGIEVILDVVYNHTESPHALQEIDRQMYYILDKQEECNYSGCGNTLRCQHPIMQDLILDSLRFFVTEYHVDGFRFDLASILTRDEEGNPLEISPLIDRITKDPILAPTKLIAEPWDCGGLDQLGHFPSWKFSEWNGRYRNHVRRFIRGDQNIEEMKNCLLGSPNLYAHKKSPLYSINFITAHDGFTLHDLTAYTKKQNEENGEDNQDGSDHNFSWNCGIEGETQNQTVLQLREKQWRNFLLTLFVSQGIPMLLMGDEYGHTRKGNNNAWCQDNSCNYFLWNQKSSLFLFVQKMIQLRKNYPILRQKTFLKKEEFCFEEKGYFAFCLKKELLIIWNPSHATYFIRKKGWYRLIDTSLASPNDFLEKAEIVEKPYPLFPFSALLFCKKDLFCYHVD